MKYDVDSEQWRKIKSLTVSKESKTFWKAVSNACTECRLLYLSMQIGMGIVYKHLPQEVVLQVCSEVRVYEWEWAMD
jgi:hypothetical protein